jgi:predicted permease
VQQAAVVVLAVIAISWLLGVALRRRSPRWGAFLRLFAALVARLAAGVVLGWTSVRAADRGGAWFALAIVLAVLALASFTFAALLLWATLKEPTPAAKWARRNNRS